MWSRSVDWLYVPTVTQKRFLVSRGLIQAPVSSVTSSGKSRNSFPQLSDEDYNKATLSSSSGTEQGLAGRARLHLRLLAQGLTKTATASAGYFSVSQARPASQPVGSSRPRGRQRPPRSPQVRHSGPRFPQGTQDTRGAQSPVGTHRLSPETASLSPIAPDSGLTMTAALPRREGLE